ncbi:SHOCT domain-containing protein [Lactococcus formosensis]|uniref:SHOCT domain-containing protein n=1 Tax=Lactococcus formosensis TaxID=1281486 RepID=UPI0024353E93|nr:SHOCT domain-containing protein [Lactococcus formosensis]MDG6125142.1 SHOCT domain-containing protein [Lactococcus formosensis]MDG6148840.1 SHOCT domain-containing protein [Lactococcus formosensis]
MSVTDELVKLKELLDAEVITKEEFAELKERALKSSRSELNDQTNLDHTKEETTSEVKTFDKSHCASCDKKINFANRMKLKDNSFICMGCFNKTGLTLGGYEEEYFKKNVTITNLFEDHKSLIKHDDIVQNNPNAIKCPKCKSTNVQFMQQGKKAFSVGKAVGGAVLTGGIGSLAGFAGKKGKKQWFCQNCNSTFETKK